MEGGDEVWSDCCAGIFLEVLRKGPGIPVIIGGPAPMPADCFQNESGGSLCYVSLFAVRPIGQRLHIICPYRPVRYIFLSL